VLGNGRADCGADLAAIRAVLAGLRTISYATGITPTGLLNAAHREPFSGPVARWTAGLRAL
jgi:hypothetical protein